MQHLSILFYGLLSVASLCLAFTASCDRPASKRDNRSAIVDTFIQELVARGQFNGNILIAERGKILYERAVGIRSPESGDLLNLDSQFLLASASKPFTALAVMQLKEEGQLDFDDPVEHYITEWPYRGTTIRNLLNHTSGIPNHRDLLDQYWKPERRYDDPERIFGGNEQMVDLFVQHRPDLLFSPGEAYGYTDTGYILLASIVERVSGIPFHQYLREHIFLPAGMLDTYAFSPLRKDPLTDRARGMRAKWDGSGFRTIDFRYSDSLEGASGIYSTIGDLFRWDQALYTDLFLPQTSLAEAFIPGKLNSGATTTYGLGWSLYLEGCVSHDGYAEGFGVWINRDMGTQNTIIILTNQGIYLWGGIIQGIRHILQGEPYELPKLNGTVLIGQTVLSEGEQAARDLYEDLKQNHPEDYELDGVNSLNTLGRLLLLDGYISEALIVFRLNADEYPGNALVWYSLGDGYLSLGDTTNAVDNYQKVLTIDPKSSHVLAKLQMLGR